MDEKVTVDSRSQLFPVGVVTLTCSGLVILYGAVFAQNYQNLFAPMNQIGPIIIFLTCGWAAYEMVNRSTFNIWSPVPWFLVTSAAYFGLGPLAFTYGTRETIQYIVQDFPVDEYWLLRTNYLNAVGVAVVCATVGIGSATLHRRLSTRRVEANDYTRHIMWVFLVIGGTVKYGFTLPYALGLLSFVLPGSVQHLAGLTNAAIILLFILIHRGAKNYYGLLFVVIGSELISGLMTFSKFEVIMTVLVVILGRFACRPNLKRLILSGLAFAVFYALVLSPFVLFARVAVSEIGVSDVNDLQDTVGEYNRVGKDALAILQPEVQSWWTRLNYAPAQAFVMDLYDGGAAGETFALLPYIFLPRLFFDDKPLMTSGKDLTLLLTGDDSSGHTGVGVFGEAYWNGGWSMVVIVCVYVGVLFVVLGQFSMRMVATNQVSYMPVILVCITTGLRPDDWFVPAFVGSMVEIFVWYMAIFVSLFILKLAPVIVPKQAWKEPQGAGGTIRS